MVLDERDLTLFLVAAGLLLLSARLVGSLFSRWHQPRVIGEIVGGLLLGPTVLGALAPRLQDDLFLSSDAAAAGLAALYNLGLIWLMFAAGTQLHTFLRRSERLTAMAIAVVGTAIPFTAGLAVFQVMNSSGLQGPAHDRTALMVVCAAALAVTSIPVISRILLDLNLMGTRFARIVLSAAVIEDAVLYAALGVAVGLAQATTVGFGLVAALDLDPASASGALYYVVAVTAVLTSAFALGRARAAVPSLLARVRDDLAWQIVFVFAAVAACLCINVPPLFGGLVAGIVIGTGGESPATAALRTYGLTFFVPIYFAIVGFRLDLIHDLDFAFFATFFAFACVIKAASVYLGARFAGESSSSARNFAVAMNARGGPGIVLASVALDAQIIDEGFYVTLVMLAVGTSLMAGWWLERETRRGREFATAEPRLVIEPVPSSAAVARDVR